MLLCPCRDKDYHLRTYKSVVMANKLIDWLIAQVSPKNSFTTVTNENFIIYDNNMIMLLFN